MLSIFRSSTSILCEGGKNGSQKVEFKQTIDNYGDDCDDKEMMLLRKEERGRPEKDITQRLSDTTDQHYSVL